jgi:hypothetical protein
VFLISDYPDNVMSLIKSAISFHGLTCHELMNCDSAIVWLQNINCPEYQTDAEVFQGNLRDFLFSFEKLWNWLLEINTIYNKDKELELFKELLPLLAGFDVAVLAFAGPFFAQIMEKAFSKFSSAKNLQWVKGEEKKFEYFISCCAWHLIITSVVLVCSPIIKELWLFISISLFIWSCYLIFKLLQWIKDMLSKIKKDSMFQIIEELDQLMDLGVNT